jgi:L-aspartate oxidase
MTDGAGVVRNARGLQKTLDEIRQIEAAQPDCAPLRNMTATATVIVTAALNRRESRGAHFRSDYPKTDDAMGRRSFLTLNDTRTLRPSSRLETT